MPKKQVGRKIDAAGNTVDLGYTVTKDEIDNWNGKPNHNEVVHTGQTYSEDIYALIDFISDIIGQVIFKVQTTNNVGVGFSNKNGILGYIGMKDTSNTGLYRWKTDLSAAYKILDEENYKTFNIGNKLSVSINTSTYVMTMSLLKDDGTVLSTQTIDLPLETMVIGASYDATNKKIVLTLKNGTTTSFSVADLVSGLAKTSDLNNKLTGAKVAANNPNIFIGYNSEENSNSSHQVVFKGNNQSNGICWSKFGNMTTSAMTPSACTYNGFFYVSSTTNSLSGADANPFLQYHTGANDFRILTTAYSDIWLQQIATDFRSEHIYIRRKENGTWTDWKKLAGTADLASYVPTSRTVNGKALSVNISLGNKDVGALPDYTLTINHGTAGNPRMVKFASVNYSSAATCFKMGAMTCHDNGVSYQFLTDMLIAVTTAGDVTANIYKFAQSSVGSVDGVTRYTGDVFYVNDTTNKIVDFYILCGQYSSSQFTPVTKVGSTTINYVTQYSGSATYYSSGTKVWVNGCGTTYARTSDIPKLVTMTQSEYDALATKDANTYYFIKE